MFTLSLWFIFELAVLRSTATQVYDAQLGQVLRRERSDKKANGTKELALMRRVTEVHDPHRNVSNMHIGEVGKVVSPHSPSSNAAPSRSEHHKDGAARRAVPMTRPAGAFADVADLSNRTAAVRCHFTIDNKVLGAYYGGTAVPVHGDTGRWESSKYIDLNYVGGKYLVITGLDHDGNSCRNGGFAMMCGDGKSSATAGWQAVGHDAQGSLNQHLSGGAVGWGAPCKSTSGFSLQGHPGAKKLWASNGKKYAAFRLMMLQATKAPTKAPTPAPTFAPTSEPTSEPTFAPLSAEDNATCVAAIAKYDTDPSDLQVTLNESEAGGLTKEEFDGMDVNNDSVVTAEDCAEAIATNSTGGWASAFDAGAYRSAQVSAISMLVFVLFSLRM